MAAVREPGRKMVVWWPPMFAEPRTATKPGCQGSAALPALHLRSPHCRVDELVVDV